MKLSAIMVKPRLPLRMLAPFEKEIFSRVLFQYIEGLDENHTRRWRRWWGRWFRDDKVGSFYPVESRSGAFHRRHMAIEKVLFEHQDAFPHYRKRAFRDWLKTGAAFGEWHLVAGQLTFVPSSLGYEDCSDDEMREFHEDAMEFLRTPEALAYLWPDMPADKRLETLEVLLKLGKETT